MGNKLEQIGSGIIISGLVSLLGSLAITATAIPLPTPEVRRIWEIEKRRHYTTNISDTLSQELKILQSDPVIDKDKQSYELKIKYFDSNMINAYGYSMGTVVLGLGILALSKRKSRKSEKIDNE